MLANLAIAIEALDIPVDGGAIVTALALRDRLDARIAEAVGAFDAAHLWDLEAATSMTAWLRTEAAMTARSARRLSARATRLRQLPACARALADGTLSGGQVDAVLAGLDDATTALFAECEAELVPYLAPLSVAGCSRAVAAWRAGAQPDGPEPSEPERSVHLSQTLDDRWILDGSLDAEGGATVAAALRMAAPADDGSRSLARRPSGAPTPWSMCAGSSSTTSSRGRVAATGPISTWWSTWRRCGRGGAAASSTGRPSTGRPCPGWCATARCTAW